jgi:hypothetical protein
VLHVIVLVGYVTTLVLDARDGHPAGRAGRAGGGEHTRLTFVRAPLGQGAGMFFFFSNRLGCLGSLLLSAALTVVLLLVLGVIG